MVQLNSSNYSKNMPAEFSAVRQYSRRSMASACFLYRAISYQAITLLLLFSFLISSRVTAQVVTVNPSSQVICSGSNTTQINFGGGPVAWPWSTVYTWSNNNTSIGLAAGPQQGNNIVSFVATNSTGSPITATITVSGEIFWGGIHNSYMTTNTCTITVNPAPTAPPAVSPASQTICTNSSVTLLASGALSGESYRWYTMASGGTPVSTSNPFISPVLASNTNYYVSIINSYGCESGRTLVPITVTPGNIEVIGSIGPTNGCYPTLQAAFAAINNGTHKGDITVKVVSSTVETGRAQLSASGGTANYNSVHLYPVNTGLSITSSLSTAGSELIDLNGADSVTIDGRVNLSGSTADLILRHTGTNNESRTIRFTNSAEKNVVRYCNILGACPSTGAGILFFSTAGTGNGNDNNVIENCNITNSGVRPYNAIYSGGSSAAQANTDNIIRNNTLYNFFNATTSGTYDNTGINVNQYNSGWVITGNNFYETTTLTSTGTGTFSVILVTSGVKHVISNNYIGGSAIQCGSTAWTKTGSAAIFNGIYFKTTVPYSGITDTSSIQGNTIRNFTWTNSNLVNWYGINISGGGVNVGTISGNFIGSETGTSSIRYISGTGSYLIGINYTSTGAGNIQNNRIGSVKTETSPNTAVCNFTGIQCSGNGIKSISSNLIGSLSTANSVDVSPVSTSGAQSAYGINSSASGTLAIQDNVIANIINRFSNASAISGQTAGILVSGGTNTISGNTVRDMTTLSPSNSANYNALSLAGIVVNVGTALVQNVTGNTIYSLKNTSAQNRSIVVTGLYLNTGTGSGTISGNFIHSLTLNATSAAANLSGIRMNGGTTSISNNIVSISSNTANASTFGIYELGGTNALYHNTVSLSGTSSAGTTRDAAYCATAGTRNVRSNIFSNTRSGAVVVNSIYISGGTTTALDYNDYTGIPVPSPGGINSVTVSPGFADPSGTSATDYVPGNPVNGISTGISTDFSGAARTCAFTMGAFEKPVTVTPPVTASCNVTEVCYNDAGTITLSSTGGNGTILQWYADSCGGTLIGSGTPLNIPSPTSTTTYYVRWEDPCSNSGCASVTVTVNPSPPAISIYHP